MIYDLLYCISSELPLGLEDEDVHDEDQILPPFFLFLMNLLFHSVQGGKNAQILKSRFVGNKAGGSGGAVSFISPVSDGHTTMVSASSPFVRCAQIKNCMWSCWQWSLKHQMEV